MSRSDSGSVPVADWLDQLGKSTGSGTSVEGPLVRINVGGKSGMTIPPTPEDISLLLENAGSAGRFSVSVEGRPPDRLEIKGHASLTSLQVGGRPEFPELVLDLAEKRPEAGTVTVEGVLDGTKTLEIRDGVIQTSNQTRISELRLTTATLDLRAQWLASSLILSGVVIVRGQHFQAETSEISSRKKPSPGFRPTPRTGP
jgi:hypothetical protein